MTQLEAIQREEFWSARVRPTRGEQILGIERLKIAERPKPSLDTLMMGADYPAWLEDEDCPTIPPGYHVFFKIRKTSIEEFQKSEFVRQRNEAVWRGLVANVRVIAGEEAEEQLEESSEEMDETGDLC